MRVDEALGDQRPCSVDLLATGDRVLGDDADPIAVDAHPPAALAPTQGRVGHDQVMAHPSAASSAAATSSRKRSAPCGATSWTPTGRPSGVRPNGTEMAGQP